MLFKLVQVSPKRLEYRIGDDQKTCVAEGTKRCGSYYEAVVFRKGQRSNRLLLHRGDSETAAVEAVVHYFRDSVSLPESLNGTHSALPQQKASARKQTAAARAPGSGEPSARPPR